MTLSAAGYIVHDQTDTIHGYGKTEAEAWEMMLGVVRHGGTEVIADDATPPDDAEWVRASHFTTMRATAALLALAADTAECTWAWRGGVACTVEEHADV